MHFFKFFYSVIHNCIHPTAQLGTLRFREIRGRTHPDDIRSAGSAMIWTQICLLPYCAGWYPTWRGASLHVLWLLAVAKGYKIFKSCILEVKADHFSYRPAFLLRESHFACYRDRCPHRKPWWPIKMLWKLPLARPVGAKMRTQSTSSGDLRRCWLPSLVGPVQVQMLLGKATEITDWIKL